MNRGAVPLLLSEGIYWMKASSGEPVPYPVVAGNEDNDERVFIARGRVGDQLAVGKMIDGSDHALIPYRSSAHLLNKYEILSNCGNIQLEWVPAKDGDVPCGAIEGGFTAKHDPIYIARCHHDGGFIVPGKLIPRDRLAYYSRNDTVCVNPRYEVLCVKSVKPAQK